MYRARDKRTDTFVAVRTLLGRTEPDRTPAPPPLHDAPYATLTLRPTTAHLETVCAQRCGVWIGGGVVLCVYLSWCGVVWCVYRGWRCRFACGDWLGVGC